MTRNQQRTLLVLGSLLAVLLALIYFLEPPEQDTAETPFEEVDSEQLRSLELQRGEELLRFQKGDGGWRLESPVSARADERRVEDLLDRVLHLALEQSLDGEPADYGLGDAPRAVLRFELDGREHELRLGSDAPVGGGTYVQLDGGPVRVARGRIAADFLRPVEDFRSHELWSFSTSAVERVRWGPADAPRLELEEADGRWWIAGGPRADPDAVRSFLRDALDLRVESFELPEQPASWDWGELAVVADGAERRLLAAEPLPGGLPVRAPLQEQPVLLPAKARELFERDARSFWLNTLLPLERYTVSKLEVHLGELEWSAEKGEAGWEDERAPEVLDVLSEQAVDRSPREAPAELRWGRIALVQSGTQEETVLIGEPGAEGALARDAAGGPAFFLPTAFLDALRGAIEEPGGSPGEAGSSEGSALGEGH